MLHSVSYLTHYYVLLFLLTHKQNHLNTLTAIAEDLLHLIYPEACLVCEEELTTSEKHLCSLCDSQLQETSHHLLREPSEFDKLFWGRTEVFSTFALYQFEKRAAIQRLLFQLKYKNAASVGHTFGARIGKRIVDSEKYAGIEALIPVPLHPKKAFIRGYNQSLMLAQGIAQTTTFSIETALVKRNIHTDSQTRKDRFQRWDNVSSVFRIHPNIRKFSHVAIVDDVVTTGSTVEAMIRAIRTEHPDVKISVLTLAIA